MSFDSGLWWPWSHAALFGLPSGITLDATGEYCAVIGRISIAGKATGKTLNTSGSSSIRFFVTAAPVFDNASSVFTVGFQGVDKTTGLPVRPNGTWSARSVITTAANTTPTLTTTSATGHVAIPTAGTVTLSHGDEVALVFEMTTGAGTDSLVTNGTYSTPKQYPAVVANTTGVAAGVGNSIGSAVITFSDGTVGSISGFLPGSAAALSWADATNPDEQGLMFQVPFACKIDAIAFPMRLVDQTSDMQFDITSTPLGTPTSIISGPIALTAENLGFAVNEAIVQYEFASEVSLVANTDYCVSVKATGAGNIRWSQLILGGADARVFCGPGGTTMLGATRNAGTGAFTTSTTVLNPLSVRISEITSGGGAIGGGNLNGGFQ
jgi:hypothetical protein